MKKIKDKKDELKKHSALISKTEKELDAKVEDFRSRLSEEQAKELILDKFSNEIQKILDGYLSEGEKKVLVALENYYSKYSMTLTSIKNSRDIEAQKLNGFMKELGYE